MTWTISKMITRIRPRNALLGGLGALALLPCGSSVPRARADPEFLPVYTSPIDITGLKVSLRAFAPDRENGRPVAVALPDGLFGPKMKQLFSTPLSTQFDQFWNAKDPITGMTAREAACEGKDGIKQEVANEVAKLGPSYSAYDISCDLAFTGQLVAKQFGSTMILGYLLTNNTVSFASRSPDTCQASHTSYFCPNDPRFSVHFATEIVTVVRTAGLCQLFASNGTSYVVAASFYFHNAAADIAHFFGGQKFVAAEVAITNTMRNRPLPLDDSFKELRTGDACTGKTPGVSRILTAFRDFETEIDLRQGIILRASHVGIGAPSLDAPSLRAPLPSFTRPMISTTQPLVTAGNTVQVKGRYFPLNANFDTTLPVTLEHEAVPVGVCFGGWTDLEWGPVSGLLVVQRQRLPGDAQGGCAAGGNATNLTPNTAYQFRARDCDPFTCSPWSATLKATTEKTEPAKNLVTLTLDGGTPLGNVRAQGTTFETSIIIPAGTSVGAHTIRAATVDAEAAVTIQVTAPSPAGGSKASIMMLSVLKSETGCPNHPISSTQTDDTFMLFGAGFAAGTVAIHLDTTTGATLGAAMVHADGSICQQMQSPPGNNAGAHTLVAVQNGAVVAQTAVTFVLPPVIR